MAKEEPSRPWLLFKRFKQFDAQPEIMGEFHGRLEQLAQYAQTLRNNELLQDAIKSKDKEAIRKLIETLNLRKPACLNLKTEAQNNFGEWGTRGYYIATSENPEYPDSVRGCSPRYEFYAFPLRGTILDPELETRKEKDKMKKIARSYLNRKVEEAKKVSESEDSNRNSLLSIVFGEK